MSSCGAGMRLISVPEEPENRRFPWGKGFHTCADGSLTHVSLVCDRRKQCRDHSDEASCGEFSTHRLPMHLLFIIVHVVVLAGSSCPWWQFACHTRGQCVASSAFCNGTFECWDKSDETFCVHPGSKQRFDIGTTTLFIEFEQSHIPQTLSLFFALKAERRIRQVRQVA